MPEIHEPWKHLTPVEPSEKQLWLLGVSDQDLAYRDALMQSTSHMIGAALRTPHGSGYYERLDNPYVGELVMEYTKGWWSHDLRIRAWSFGVLVSRRQEWLKSIDEHRRESGVASYVRWGRGDQDVQRWENSKFVLVPVERDTFGP